MNRKNSGKKGIKITSKKAVHIMKKQSNQAVHIKPKSQKAHKKAVSQKIISKEAIPKKTLPQKKPKEIIRRQKKENAMQRRNGKKEFSPAGHMLEIQKLEDELSSLNALLKEKRKSGIDTFVDEMKLFTVPPKIQLLKIEFSEKKYSGVSSTLSDVRISLESAKPELIVLGIPAVDEGGKNPFENAHREESPLPLSEDAKNYAKELGRKKISFSEIRDSFSKLFRKRGGK
jgi:hypothetical protein